MEEALIKRVLPHSVEAEQSVIGSMIMDRDAIMTASEVITSEDFYQSQYGVLFDAMLELYNEGKPVDLVTLQERLREKDVPPEISSLEFAKDLLDAVPTSANVRHYATIVQEKSMLRKLIKVNEEIANTCYLAKERTEDILGYLGAHKREGQFLCGFSMETEHMLENSRAKLKKKNVDMIVANNLKVQGAGFGTDTNIVTIITENKETELEILSKDEVADRILNEILKNKKKL